MGTGYTFLYQSYRFRVVLVAALSLLCIGSWPNMERLFLFEWVNDKTLFRLGLFSRMECKNWHGLAQKGKHLRTEQWKTFPNSNKIFQICQVNKLRVAGLLCSGGGRANQKKRARVKIIRPRREASRISPPSHDASPCSGDLYERLRI